MLKRRQVVLEGATSMVPNFFTVGNMALGFFAILAALDKRWVAAPVAIFIAHVLDILDGRLARWIHKTSRFGAEFDSFADWMSFGIAPAIMIYQLALKDYGQLGLMLSFLFVLCGALRLARFNLKSAQLDEPSSANFVGLPIPGAGGFLAILVLLVGLSQEGVPGKTLSLIYNRIALVQEGIPVIVFVLSLLMISKLHYATFKRTHLFRPQSIRTFFITLFIAFMIFAYPQNTIFILYVGYILWGIVNTGWRAYRLKKGAHLGLLHANKR